MPKISQREMARELRVTHPTIGRWESGETQPALEDVAAYLEVLGLERQARDQILELVQDKAETDWLVSGPPGISTQLAGVMECERTARRVVLWEPLVIPGVLQTSGYARAIFGRSRLSPVEIETQVTLRMGRRDIITRSEPVELLTLIGEPAIRGGIGGPKVMADQLQHLLDMSKLDNVTVQVASLSGEWHPGYPSPFVIYESPIAPEVVYLEHLRTGAFITDEDDVAAFKTAAEDIRRVAMSPEESVELIAQSSRRWREHG